MNGSLDISRHVQPLPQSILERFYHLKKKSHTCSHHPTIPHPHHSPWQPLIYLPSLWVCLFWTLHANEVVQCVVLYDSFLSVSIMFSRFIHVVARVSVLHSFLWLNNIPSYE